MREEIISISTIGYRHSHSLNAHKGEEIISISTIVSTINSLELKEEMALQKASISMDTSSIEYENVCDDICTQTMVELRMLYNRCIAYGFSHEELVAISGVFRKFAN